MTPQDQIYSLPTNVGAAKLAYALANQLTVNISHMALGDGNGAPVNPTAAATALVREVHRAQLNQLYQHQDNANWLVAELVLPAEVGGWTIREIGLYDTEGALIFVGNHAEQYKPVQSQGSDETKTIRMVILVSSVAAVTLKTDPSTVMATIKYVNDRTPPASVAAPGLVELATDAEVQAGTDAGRAVTPAGLSARTATTTRTGLVELATAAEVQAGTDTERAITPAGLASRTATDARAGVVELATDAEVQAGTDTSRAVTPAGLAARTATDTRAGVVELATDAEVQAGTDTSRAVTPAGLASRTATETRAGVVELATSAEAQAGTDTARAVHSAGLAATIGARYASDNVWRDANITVSLTASRSYERLPNNMVRIFGTITGTADSAGKGTARVNFPFTLAAFRSAICSNWQSEATLGNGYDASVSMCTTTYLDLSFKTLNSGQLRMDYEVTGNL